ncbi:MAG: Polyketide cyclase / dehydrase and lipid transport [Bacteroidetes bacterium]|nr:Polyketide cyclase / dehydrase and lipid transport [Bacteroidota bacterium]
MKFTCTTEINAPMDKVVALFDNPDNLRHWQQGYVSTELIRGKTGEVGAQSKITLNFRGRPMILIETLRVRDLPYEIKALYEHEHMINTATHRFYPLDGRHTKYETEVHYTQFIGIMPKLMALLMPGMFRKQTQLTVERFKAFAEKAHKAV